MSKPQRTSLTNIVNRDAELMRKALAAEEEAERARQQEMERQQQEVARQEEAARQQAASQPHSQPEPPEPKQLRKRGTEDYKDFGITTINVPKPLLRRLKLAAMARGELLGRRASVSELIVDILERHPDEIEAWASKLEIEPLKTGE